MALYPEEVIAEVRNRNDIVEIASAYTRLKKSGNDMVGLCPFHSEKTPSFRVSADRQSFYCFGCGAGGTTINFVMRAENLGFVDALKYLADRVGMNLPEPGHDDSKQAELYERKKKIIAMNVVAAKYFHQKLMDEKSVVARKYVAYRGLSPQIVNRFGLGCALDEWRGLCDELKKNGYTDDDAVMAGLAVKHETKGTVYDKFRNRLMFPIIDVRGNVIAFSGRILGDGMPKYMNSPDTPVYNKSHTLFGLNFAKNEVKSGPLILVEGNVDVVSLHMYGFTNTIATCGTSFNEGHARLIKKYSSQVIMCFDSDEAGQKATIKAADILISQGVIVKVMEVDDAKDPDEYIKKKGAEKFAQLVKDAKPYIQYRVDKLREKHDLKDLSQKIEFTNRCAEILAGVSNEIEREAYIREVAKSAGVSPESVMVQVKKLTYSKEKTETIRALKETTTKTSAVGTKGGTKDKKEIAEKRLERSEKMLAALMFKNKKIYEYVKKELGSFTSDALNRMCDILEEVYAGNKIPEAADIISKFPQEEVSYITSVFYQTQEFDDPNQAAKDLVVSIKNERDKLRMSSLLESGDVAALNAMLQKKKTEEKSDGEEN